MSLATATSPGSGKRALTKKANRQAILDAASKVFARDGYEAASIRDIIRETSLASGTFYNYFKSKEEIFETIAAESAKRFQPRLKIISSQATDLVSYFRAAYAAYFDFLVEENNVTINNGGPHRAMIGVRIDTPEIKAISDQIRNDIENVLRITGPKHLDAGYLTAAAIGIARQMGDLMLSRRPLEPEVAAAFASRLMLAGIKDFAKHV